MKARSITFPDELYKKLEQAAKDKSISVASVIKIACSEYLSYQNFKNPIGFTAAVDKLFPNNRT